MATHSSVLVRRIPGMGEPCGLPSMGSHRAGHDCSDLAAAAASSQSSIHGPERFLLTVDFFNMVVMDLGIYAI